MAKQRHIDSLIVREIVNDLNEAETNELKAWLSDDKQNVARYDRIKSSLQSGQVIKDWNEINLDSNWDDILKKAGKKTFRISPFIRYASAAAILLFAGVWIIGLLSNTTISNESSTPLAHELPDGSHVWLKQNASITYIEADFSEDRTLKMDGEVYYEVQKSTVPFTVDIGKTQVQVLGTSFNINETADSTEVILVEGSVRFKSNTEEHILKPGEKAIYSTKGIQKKNQFDINQIGWKSGVFQFSEVPLKKVMEQVSSYYGIEHQIAPEKAGLLVSMNINNSTLSEFIEELTFILDVEIENKTQSLIIK